MTTLGQGGLDEAPILRETGRHLPEQVALDDWLPEAFVQPHPQFYQQYLLHRDPLGRISVVSFVWGPGQRMPIRDHTVSGAIGMLRNAEWVRAFELRPVALPLPVGEKERLDADLVTFLSPSSGDVHQVWNAHADLTSTSIHVYGGNIGRIRRQVFGPEDGAAKEFVSGYSSAVVPNLWAQDKP